MAIPFASIGTALKGIGSKVGSFMSSDGFANATSGLGALGSFLGIKSGRSVRDAKSMMQFQRRMQQEYTQWLNENQYSFMRTGLENAGYNPLLALGASPSEGSVGLATPNSASGDSDPFAMLSAMATTAQIRKLNADIADKNQNVVEKVIDNLDTIFKKLGLPDTDENTQTVLEKAGEKVSKVNDVVSSIKENSAKSRHSVVRNHPFATLPYKIIGAILKSLYHSVVPPNPSSAKSFNSSNPALQQVFDLKDTGYSPIINSRVPKY